MYPFVCAGADPLGEQAAGNPRFAGQSKSPASSAATEQSTQDSPARAGIGYHAGGVGLRRERRLGRCSGTFT